MERDHPLLRYPGEVRLSTERTAMEMVGGIPNGGGLVAFNGRLMGYCGGLIGSNGGHEK